MTDNEKRAHDIAIACIQIQAKFLKEEAIRNKHGIKMDLYNMYRDAYETALTAVTRDFPDGR